MRWISAGGVAIVLCAAPTAYAAIIPTSVSFNGPFHGYGSYSETTLIRDKVSGFVNEEFTFNDNAEVGRTEQNILYSPLSISIVARALGYGYFSYTEPRLDSVFETWSQPSVRGTTSFTLDSPGLFDLSWRVGGAASWSPINAYLLIRDATGHAMVACNGYGTGECDNTLDPNDVYDGIQFISPPGAADLRMALPAGAYELLYGVASDHGAGVTVGSNFSFSMTAVPIPQTIGLLLSGLLFPSVLTRRRCKMPK